MKLPITRDGSVHNLGNLGGTINNTLLGSGTVALSINNRGQVTGVADLPGDQIRYRVVSEVSVTQ
ncbi:hypothetical protein [Tunturiibacter gelidiferens]|uniref:hypothetical protein n=1 Tax=Tunturiibacter gelidiferens TaxID=3069689 RepID=UPI003D9B6070